MDNNLNKQNIPLIEIPKQTDTPKQNNFLVILLSGLLFLSILIAGFFAYQVQTLVNDLMLLKNSPTPLISDVVDDTQVVDDLIDTSDWETYPPKSIVGLSYSFKYPKTTILDESQDLVLLQTGNGTIYHRFLGKQTDLTKAMENFKPWGTNEQVILSDEKQVINYNLLNGYRVASSDGNNTFLFLGSNNLNGILVFHYPTVEQKSKLLLDQILSTVKLID